MLKLEQVLTLKNCIEPFSYASTAYVVASALVSVRPICKNLSNLQKIFGQMVYRPPLAKNSPYAYVLLHCKAYIGVLIVDVIEEKGCIPLRVGKAKCIVYVATIE